MGQIFANLDGEPEPKCLGGFWERGSERERVNGKLTYDAQRGLAAMTEALEHRIAHETDQHIVVSRFYGGLILYSLASEPTTVRRRGARSWKGQAKKRGQGGREDEKRIRPGEE